MEDTEALVVTEPRTVTAKTEEMDAAIKSIGMVRIQAVNTKALRDLGIQMEGLGVVRMGQGGLAVGQQALLGAVVRLSNIIEETKEVDVVDKAAKTLGYVVDKLAKLAESATRINDTPALPPAGDGVSPNTPRRASFAPGTIVAQTVHQHFSTPPPENTVAKEKPGP